MTFMYDECDEYRQLLLDLHTSSVAARTTDVVMLRGECQCSLCRIHQDRAAGRCAGLLLRVPYDQSVCRRSSTDMHESQASYKAAAVKTTRVPMESEACRRAAVSYVRLCVA